MKKIICLTIAVFTLLGGVARADSAVTAWKENFNGYETGTTAGWQLDGNGTAFVTEHFSQKNKSLAITPADTVTAKKQFAPISGMFIINFTLLMPENGNCILSYTDETFVTKKLTELPHSGGYVLSAANGRYTVSADGEVIGSGIIDKSIRGMGFTLSADGTYIIDDIYVYSGTTVYSAYELLTFDEKHSSKYNDALVLKIGCGEAIVNGDFKEIDGGSVMPVVVNDRTFVPLRFVAEAFGAEVAWNDGTVSINDSIYMKVGDAFIIANGAEKMLEAAIFVENDRTMVPLRTVAEALDKIVFWDDNGLIIVSDEQKFDAENALPDDAALIEKIYERINRVKTVETDGQKYTITSEFIGNSAEVANVWATDDDGNLPQYAVDGSLATRWSAEFEQSITFDLGEIKSISYVGIAWNGGAERRAIYDLEVSDDGDNWTTIYDGMSSGKSDYYEITYINSDIRYLRYNGHGYVGGSWNSVKEVEFIEN